MSLAIEQGEKFACVVFSGLNIAFREVPDPVDLGFGCWGSSRLPFRLDPSWRQQLGDIVCEQLEHRCSFVLLAKQPAASNDPFGEESQILRNRVLFLTWGVAVTAGVPAFSFARLIFGAVIQSDKPKLAFASFHPFYESLDADKPQADVHSLRVASAFCQRIEEIQSAHVRDPWAYHRLESGIHALVSAFQSSKASPRLHQFVRAIEACMPASVRGRTEFAEHGAVFLSDCGDGDGNTETTLLQMYDLRSAAEHHRRFDKRALPQALEPERVAMRRTRQAEVFARELYRRFLAINNRLPVFLSEESLEDFWKDRDRVRHSWGSPLDLSVQK